MGEEMMPAGLGSTIYVCSVEEFEKNPNAPMQKLEGMRIDLRNLPKQEDSEWEPEEGWSVTGTVTLESPHAAEEFKRFLRKSLFGEGRLPRKEKKRRMNRVLRDKRVVMVISALMYSNSTRVLDVLSSLMFPEQIHMDTDNRTHVVTPNPAQLRVIILCMRRIPKQTVRLFRKHRKMLLEDLEQMETKANHKED